MPLPSGPPRARTDPARGGLGLPAAGAGRTDARAAPHRSRRLPHRPTRPTKRAPRAGRVEQDVSARTSWASLRLRTIRARSTRLTCAVLLGDDDDHGIGLLGDPQRRAVARAEALALDRRLARGSSAPAATIVSPRMITAPSWSGLRGMKIVSSRSGERSRVDHHAALRDLAEAGLALEHHQRAGPVGCRRSRRGRPRGRRARLRAARPAREPRRTSRRARSARAPRRSSGWKTTTSAKRPTMAPVCEDLGEHPQVAARARDRVRRRTGR